MIRDVIAKILAISLVGLGAGLLPSLSFGLGLGDIQVESRLHQPLSARIEVVDVSDNDWLQIRARIAPRTLLSEAAVHPEVLGLLTLRAVENSTGRHFIEVKSAEVLTEPLFDLPVEVAGQSLQVVRNYSVLLDPAGSEDAPRGAPVVAAGPAVGGGDGAVSESGVAHEDGATPHAGRIATKHYGALGAHGIRNRSSVSRKPTDSANTTGVSATTTNRVAYADAALGRLAPSGQKPLEGQLAMLQQTLTKMQATIASQDAEIAKLTAQVAVRSESSVSRRPTTWVEYPTGKSGASSESARDTDSGWSAAWSATLYWIGGALVGIGVVALGVVGWLRWRHARMLREIALQEAARRPSSPKPAVAPTSDRELLTWQSNLRAAQSAKKKPSLEDTFDPASGVSSRVSSSGLDLSEPMIMHANLESARSGQSSKQSRQSAEESAALASTSDDTASATIAIEELTPDLEADLESLNASYEAEHLQSSSDGIAAWRKQNEMLERDYLSDTEALPQMEPGNQAEVAEGERDQPEVPRSAGVADAAASEPGTREVVQILQQSLDFEPDRLDLQLKLLEIYHQEALGNRENFDSLLRKLAAASQQLSPAQQLHVEMLQRTLREGKQATEADLIADVAV